jgi:hypothetical protein
MKKLVLAFVAGLFAFSAFSQNIQTHYDMGKDRGYITTTVEMFKPDKTGNTFFFIDFDYGSNGVKNSPSLAYFEIARCFKLGKSPFSWQVEYNGGLFQSYNKTTKAYAGQPISNAWLTGVDYSWNAPDFSRGISLNALYKNIANTPTPDAKPNNFQLTAVWYVNFAKGKMRFCGFADFWKEKHTVSSDGFVADFQTKNYIFLTEPQLWYNFTPKFAAGSEIEISNNFGGNAGFMINPTAALKYTF